MWAKAKTTLEQFFFKDMVALYETVIEEDSLGEDIDSLELVGQFKCNIELAPSLYKEGVVGISVPQRIRVSTAKDFPITPQKTYALKIVKSRAGFDPLEDWLVVSTIENHFSTIIDAEREVSI